MVDAARAEVARLLGAAATAIETRVGLHRHHVGLVYGRLRAAIIINAAVSGGSSVGEAPI